MKLARPMQCSRLVDTCNLGTVSLHVQFLHSSRRLLVLTNSMYRALLVFSGLSCLISQTLI